MTILISAILYIAVTAAVYFFKDTIKIKKENVGISYFKQVPLLLCFAVQTLYFAVTAVSGHTVDIISCTVSSVLIALAANVLTLCKYKDFFKSSEWRSFFKGSACAVIAVVFLELTVFNISALSSPSTGKEKSLDIATAAAGQNITVLNGGKYITSDDESGISFQGVSADTENVALTFTGAEKWIDVKAYITDDNLSGTAVQVCEESVYTGDKPAVLNIHSTNLQSVQLYFNGASGVEIVGVSINAAVPVQINYLRFFGLIVICLLAVAIKSFNLYKIRANKNSFVQKAAIIVAVFFCCSLFLTVFMAKGNDALEIYQDSNLSGKSPYYQMFDAFQKGQLNLDLPVDSKLASAGDKAYDPNYRANNGIQAQWDRSYYNGKYYSYFGTAPLFLIYYPIYHVTGKLPADSFVCALLGMIITIFGFMLVRKISLSVVKNASFILSLLCGFALPFAAGCYILTGYGDFYNIPKLCASAFLLLLIYLTIAAYEKPRLWLFLLCGISVALIAASRPNLIILSLATAPIYIAVLLNKEISLKSKLSYIGVFLAPVIICAAVLMIYNYQRFGSFFEFGNNYQLTVNNVALNNISLAYLGLAFYHYFLQPVQTSPSFPYISPSATSITCSRYFYTMNSFGVLAVPLNWLALAYPAARKSSGLKPAYRWFIALSLILSVVAGFLDFCMAGVTISYVCDIALTVSVAAVILLLLCENSTANSLRLQKYFFVFSVVIIALTVFIETAMLLSIQETAFKANMPDLYKALADACTF